VTECACGFTILPALRWEAWEATVSEHLGQIPDLVATRSGNVIEVCKHHGLTEFHVVYRKGKRQRNCLACGRERDQRHRAARKTAV
jgi:hypothetical protein